MHYMMAPLEEHFDYGFGAVAEAFKQAADTLAKENDGKPLFWNDLPEVFLLRHTIELFLKSGIIIMHRRLKLSYGSEPHSSKDPMCQLPSGVWKPLSKTHDIPNLYAYWKRLITDNKDKLTRMMKHEPDITVPTELDGWISELSAVDPGSDYFRYPISKNRAGDKDKSSFKEVSVLTLPPKPEQPGTVKALVVENEKGDVVRVFMHDASTNKNVTDVGRKAADMLNNFHAMMRFELTEGW